MKILVTGAAGFLGNKLIPRLVVDGHDVVWLDKRKNSLLSTMTGGLVDITDDAAMTGFEARMKVDGGVDACVHLAAVAAPRQATADPRLAWDTNVRGTHNVLSLCRNLGVRKVVFASSAHVYGISPRYMPTDEQHPLALLDTYTVTKIAGEKLCELFHANYDLSYTVLRLFNAYGPSQSPDYFIGKKISEAAAGKISIMNGGVTKDWVWADDVASAMARAVETAYVGPLNIGTGCETSLLEIAGLIATAYGAPVEEDLAVDVGPTRMCCDAGRAKRVLGWESTVPFAAGLSAVIRAAKFGRGGEEDS